MVERNNTRYILRTAILLLLSFSCLALYVVYLQVWEADRLAQLLPRTACCAAASLIERVKFSRSAPMWAKGDILTGGSWRRSRAILMIRSAARASRLIREQSFRDTAAFSGDWGRSRRFSLPHAATTSI